MTSTAAIRHRLLFPVNGRDSDETEITCAKTLGRRDETKIDLPPPKTEDSVWSANIVRNAPSTRLIIETVADFYGLSLVEMLGEDRRSYLVTARWMAMYIARKYGGKSNSEIGRQCAGRDHTTVINGVNKIKIRLLEEKRLREDLAEIRGRLNSVPRILEQPEHVEV